MAETPDSSIAEKAADLRRKLATAYQAAGRLSDAEAQLMLMVEASEPREGIAPAGVQLDTIVELGLVQAISHSYIHVWTPQAHFLTRVTLIIS